MKSIVYNQFILNLILCRGKCLYNCATYMPTENDICTACRVYAFKDKRFYDTRGLDLVRYKTALTVGVALNIISEEDMFEELL